MRKTLCIYFLLGTLFLSNCIDDKYNLDDVDWTFGTTNDLWLPLSSTSDIILKNVLDVDNNGPICIKYIDGVEYYYLEKEGSADIKPVEIGEIRIDRPKADDFNAKLNVREMICSSRNTPSEKKRKLGIELGGQKYDVEDADYVYDINEYARTTVSETVAENITSDIVDIKHIGCEDFTICIHLHTEGLLPWMKRMHLDNLAIIMPKGFNIKKCTYRNKDIDVSGIENGYLKICDVDEEGFLATETLELALTACGMNIGDTNFASFNSNNHCLQAGGDFRAEGMFRFSLSDVDENHMSADEKATVIRTHSFLDVVPEKVNFIGKADFSGDIILNSFSGAIRHDVDRTEPILLKNLPSFLENNEVRLDLKNPQIYIKVTNNVPALASTSLYFESKKDGEVFATKYTNQFNIEPCNTTTYCFANNKPDIYPDAFKNVRYIQVPKLGELITYIPDEIDVSVSSLMLPDCENIQIGADSKYNVDVDYLIYSPLQFGPNTKIIYEDVENGLSKDLETLEETDASEIHFEGLVDSELPLDLTITFVPIDINGNTISQLEAISTNVPSKAKNFTISLGIKPKTGYMLNDFIVGKNGVERLDGVIIRAIANNPFDGETLNALSSIRIHDAKVGFKGGFTYHAN